MSPLCPQGWDKQGPRPVRGWICACCRHTGCLEECPTHTPATPGSGGPPRGYSDHPAEVCGLLLTGLPRTPCSPGRWVRNGCRPRLRLQLKCQSPQPPQDLPAAPQGVCPTRCPADQASTAKGLACRLVWPGLASASFPWPPNHPGNKRRCPTPRLTPQGWGEGTAGAPSWWGPQGTHPPAAPDTPLCLLSDAVTQDTLGYTTLVPRLSPQGQRAGVPVPGAGTATLPGQSNRFVSWLG